MLSFSKLEPELKVVFVAVSPSDFNSKACQNGTRSAKIVGMAEKFIQKALNVLAFQPTFFYLPSQIHFQLKLKVQNLVLLVSLQFNIISHHSFLLLNYESKM